MSTKCRACGAVLRAGAKYCDQCGTREPLAAEGEKRQATIMICDLVGSTLLATSLSPEDLRRVFTTYREAVAPIVRRLGGSIVRYEGDGIQALFGLPAYEDSAERAVRGGLEIVDAVRALRPLPDVFLDVRVGIATGVCIVGDVIGEGASREEEVTGEAPHLAARLNAMAAPGTVFVSDSTKRLVSGFFDFVALEATLIKGFKERIAAWRVLAEREVLSRFEATHPLTELSPLVGREEELRELLDRWQCSRTGAGQVVMLRGEAGIGKSRLGQALRDRVANETAALLQYFCAPRFENTALHPVIAQIGFAAGLTRDDSADVKLDKLEAVLKRTTPADQLPVTVPYIAALLSIPFADRYRPIEDSPERQRERTLAALRGQVAGLARAGPVLMICEDLHWADPSTRDLIETSIPDVAKMPVFLLITSRPSEPGEANPPWLGPSNTALLDLSPLGRESSGSIVSHLARGKRLPSAILQQILDKSEGVPLVVEELTKNVLELGLLEEGAEDYRLKESLPALTIPSTLQDSLLARLDRLSAPVKEVAQVGAAIGREFSYELIAAVHPTSGRKLHAALVRLGEADLIQRHGTASKATYVFKHALIQDAAHETMLSDTRKRHHARIAEILETPRFAETAKSEPELIAHHLTEAANFGDAIPYWQEAGIRAGARAAYAEAIEHFLTALRLLVHLPEDASRYRLEVGLQVQLGLSVSASRGYAAPEVERAYQRARELCHLLGDTAELFPVIRGLCTFYIVRSELVVARELAEQCLRLGEETKHPVYLIEGYTALGYILVYMGYLEAGCGLLAKAVEVYRSENGEGLSYPSAQDPALACLCLSAIAVWMCGDVSRAERLSKEGLDHARKLAHPFDLAYAFCFTAFLENLRGRHAAAIRHANAAIQLSQQHGFGVWLGQGTIQLAIAKCKLGEANEAIPILGATLAAWKASGAELSRPFALSGLAQGYAATRETACALSAIEEAIAHAERYHEHYCDAELFRLRGELLAVRDDSQADVIEASLRRAVGIAREQQARLFELRASTSLHAFCLARGRPDESRALLMEAINFFDRADFELPELNQAKTLLGRG